MRADRAHANRWFAIAATRADARGETGLGSARLGDGDPGDAVLSRRLGGHQTATAAIATVIPGAWLSSRATRGTCTFAVHAPSDASRSLAVGCAVCALRSLAVAPLGICAVWLVRSSPKNRLTLTRTSQ